MKTDVIDLSNTIDPEAVAYTQMEHELERGSCDCPVCTSTIWDRSTGYRAPLDYVPQPNRLKPAGLVWLMVTATVGLGALFFALRALFV